MAPAPEEPDPPATTAAPPPKARRRHRGGRRQRPRSEAAPPVATAETVAPEEPTPEPEARPKSRTARRRAQRRRAAEAAHAPEAVAAPEPQRRRRPAAVREPQPPRRAAVAREPAPPRRAAAPPEAPPRRRRAAPRRRAGKEAPIERLPGPFVHPSEAEFAGILDFYNIEWKYEPRSFPLRWEHGRVAEAFTPDFYLSEFNLYVELTTLKSNLTAEKNRKVRLLRQLYPEVNVKLLKKRDLFRLLTKYGYGPLDPEEVPDIDHILISTGKLQQRVVEMGKQISSDYANQEPVLVGVLRGVFCFLADLVRHISVPVTLDFMSISSYEGDGGGAVKILKDLDENIKGRDVILVEDIVDTGMTLNHVLDYLWAKKPASLRVCTLLDKSVRRLTTVNVDYVGFEVPDEFVVGYGLDFRQRYRNLPFIAVLKHELLP